MKPRPFVLITALIYIGIGISGSLFAQDVYKHAMETYSHSNCENFVMYNDGNDNPIFAEPQVLIVNPYNISQNITYTFKMCTVEDGRCAPQYSKNINVPIGGRYQHTYRLNMNVRYKKAGDYHYTVSTDISGDITEHTEKTCGIHVRKD